MEKAKITADYPIVRKPRGPRGSFLGKFPIKTFATEKTFPSVRPHITLMVNNASLSKTIIALFR